MRPTKYLFSSKPSNKCKGINNVVKRKSSPHDNKTYVKCKHIIQPTYFYSTAAASPA